MKLLLKMLTYGTSKNNKPLLSDHMKVFLTMVNFDTVIVFYFFMSFPLTFYALG